MMWEALGTSKIFMGNEVTVYNKGGATCNNSKQLLQTSSLVINMIKIFQIPINLSGIKDLVHGFWGYIMANFHKLCSITLTSVTHADFCVKDAGHLRHSVGQWWGSSEGNQLFICIIHTTYPAVPAKCYVTWLTQLFLWSVLIVLNEAMQTVT